MAKQSSAQRDYELRQLIRLCQEGDLEAFRVLVQAYHGSAESLARRLVGNRQDAQDIVQEAFIRVWRHLARYDLRKSFTTWLFRIVTNLAYDVLRKRLKHGAALTSWSDHDDFIAHESAHDEALQIAMTIRYKAARLPLKQQLVFVLRDLQELSVAEVAKILDISQDAVKVNLYHARHALRRYLEADFDS